MLVGGLAAVSWQRWINPIVDCGREMYVPWRLAEGDVLYRDLFFVYGPLVPYWHAALFRVFGIHLDVLYAAGLAIGCAHVLVVFALSRRLLSPALAAGAAALVAVEFVFHPSIDNLVFPYSFNASYASLLNLTAAWCLLGSDRCRQRAKVLTSASCVALSCLSRQDFGMAAAVFWASYALVSARRSDARVRRTVAIGASLALVITGLGYAAFAREVGFMRLIDESLWPRRMLAAMGLFERHTVGTVFDFALVAGLLAHGTGILAAAVLIVASVYLGERHTRLLGLLVAVALALIMLLSPASSSAMDFLYRGQIHATSALVLIASCLIARRMGGDAAHDVWWLALLALLQTWRSPLFGGVSVYSAFYMPAGVALLVWLVAEGAAMVGRVRDRVTWQRATVLVCGVWCGLATLVTARVFRTQLTERVEAERGVLFVSAAIAPAFAGLLDLVRSSTRPDEPVLLLPEDNAVHFLAPRRSIRTYYQLIPGIVDVEGERQVVAAAEREGVRLASVSNRATPDYGATFFGIDYDREVYAWLQSRFRLTQRLGNPVRPSMASEPGLLFPKEGYGVEIYMR